MSTKLPYMPLYVADYLADTTHLTCEEHGAYMLLLMVMWKAGGSLPADDKNLARIARVNTNRWKKMAPNLMPFFQLEDGVLTHKRITEEIESARGISKIRSEVGKKGAEAKALKDREVALANANALPQQTSGKTLPLQTPDSRENITNSGALDLAPRAAPPPEEPSPMPALCVELGKRITDLMGVSTDPRWLGNWSQVQIWLSQGFDPELDIWPAVSARIDRMKQTKARMPSSLKYFSNIIAEHHKARTEGRSSAPAPGTAATASRSSVWVWKDSPQWEAWSRGRARPWPTSDQRHPDGGKRPGWYFPSEWPPGTPNAQENAA